MLHPSQFEKKADKTERGLDESLYRRPEVSLLDDGQWLYVQRRYHLSPRELQVAKLVCKGFGNEEVAGCLRIRCGTVKTHLRNIYRRIHATNKIEMLLNFVEQVARVCSKTDMPGGVAVVNLEKAIKQETGSLGVGTGERQTGF